MTDLIRIEGFSFKYHPLPLPKARLNLVHHSIVEHGRLIRPGFKHMHRLRPRDPAVSDRIQQMSINHSCIGFHVRHTDNQEDQRRFLGKNMERHALRNLREVSRRCRTKYLFLAADNARSLQHWMAVLDEAGYEVKSNHPEFDDSKLRQTGSSDMLVDFFALAACRRVVRVTPSEFSRFAAWVGGRRLRYSQLK